MADNYQLQALQARKYFLRYDQQQLIGKCHLKSDRDYLYLQLFGISYRLNRSDGALEKFLSGRWQDAGSHGEVMTVLDLLCDSDPLRHAGGRFRSMQDFGHRFHQNLGEHNPLAALLQAHPQALRKACESLGGTVFPQGDIAYEIPVFEDLHLILQLWLGDEEFPSDLRFLWDENALLYLKYETMYYAVDVLTAYIKTFF